MAFQISEFSSSFGLPGPARPTHFDAIVFAPIYVDSPGIASGGGGQGIRRISLRCESAEIPGRNFATAESGLFGAERKMPYLHAYNDINLTFLCSGQDFFERRFFDKWQMYICSSITHYFRYPKHYWGQIQITQYNTYGDGIYSVKLEEAYPIQVVAQDLSWAEKDSVQKLTVTFAYHRWMNDEIQYQTDDFMNQRLDLSNPQTFPPGTEETWTAWSPSPTFEQSITNDIADADISAPVTPTTPAQSTTTTTASTTSPR